MARASFPTVAACLLLASSPASAQLETSRPAARGKMVRVDAPTLGQGALGPPAVIYLNRCVGDCTLTPGMDDSIANRSSIIDGPITVGEFNRGNRVWDDMVACVQEIYAPFNVVVTDKDPGDTPHHEAIVAGTPAESGFPNTYGGVAPFACGVIPNSVTFTFANIWFTAQDMCEVVAQETAHAFGLDHEMLCSDPMTYLRRCAPQRAFQDEPANCGEDKDRACFCGGSVQNSFRHILELFGPGDLPYAEIISPSQGAVVRAGFKVEADPGPTPIHRLEFRIDGELIEEAGSPPYSFEAPRTLAPGGHSVELRAFDHRDLNGSSQIQLTIAPCDSSAACGDGYHCLSGRCVLGPGQPGGIGEACDADGECSGELCGRASDGAGMCSAACVYARDQCPDGFTCSQSNAGAVCWPRSTGGCSATGFGNSGAAALLVMLLLAMVGGGVRTRW